VAGNQVQEDPAGAQRATHPAASSGEAYLDSRQVLLQLERILESPEFIGSNRTHRFLRYVVEEALAGRANRIKAYSVAVAAFDRDESFDPQSDPIVRIEAGRVRRSLERYYLVAGAADPIRIDIPRGTYVPTFASVDIGKPDTLSGVSEPAPAQDDPTEPPPAPGPRALLLSQRSIFAIVAILALVVTMAVLLVELDPSDEPADAVRPDLPRPSVAILAFSTSGGEQPIARLARGINNEVIRELSRYQSVFVLSPQALQRFGDAPDVTFIGSDTGVDFVLSGDILVSGDRFQLSVGLSDAMTGGIIWAETYDRVFAIDRLFDTAAEIARDIVHQIGQPQGAIAIFDWKRTRGMAPENWEAYDCVVQADELHRRIAPPGELHEVLSCLETVTAEEPGYADAWILLALIEIDRVRFSPMADMPPDSPERAYAAASRALDLAPDSGRTHLAFMSALAFQGNIGAALAAGQVAARLSPRDADLLAEVGLRNVVAGDLKAGMQFLNEAMRYSQSAPASYQLSLSLGYLREGAYQKALDAVAALAPKPNFVHYAIVSAVYGKAGDLDRARKAANELLKLYPDFTGWAWRELELRSMAPALATAMVEGWRAAGLKIPPSPDSARPD